MKPYKTILLSLLFISMIYASCSDEKSASFESLAPTESASIADTAMTEERVIIKTADITMNVNKVEESVQTFQTLVNNMHGHVFHYEIQNEKQFQNEVKYSFDSSVVINEINPNGLMKVKIPIQYGDTFIASVLKMNGSIDHFMFDENDVTEEITEKKELMQSDASIVSDSKQPETKTKKPKKVEAIYLAKDLNESYIKRKADYSATNYQAKHLWFDINLHGKKYTSNEMIATSKWIHTPFYVSAVEALGNGWHGFSVFITLLLNLWPFAILSLLIWIAIRKKWFKRVFGFN